MNTAAFCVVYASFGSMTVMPSCVGLTPKSEASIPQLGWTGVGAPRLPGEVAPGPEQSSNRNGLRRRGHHRREALPNERVDDDYIFDKENRYGDARRRELWRDCAGRGWKSCSAGATRPRPKRAASASPRPTISLNWLHVATAVRSWPPRCCAAGRRSWRDAKIRKSFWMSSDVIG